MSVVTLYGKPECCLCDEARDAILALRAEGFDLELQEVDITGDSSLRERYWRRIPVVTVDGQPVSELGFQPGALRSRLDRLSA